MGSTNRQPPQDPPASPPPLPAKAPVDRATCSACGLRSISAMIVKRLDGDRGRCVNTAACEKRQKKKATATR